MYKRKTRTEYHILVNYGHGDGWEHECTELTRTDARNQLACYREDCSHPVRMVAKRVRIEG